MNEIMENNPSTDDVLQHGVLLGQRRAFGVVAGRCSAAHAESLRSIRESKLYLHHAPTWNEYCTRVLKMSRRSADRMIGLLKEFGPAYFEVTQLTGITPEVYRAIAPAIGRDGIHVDGEIVALLPENAAKAAEAIARLAAGQQPSRERNTSAAHLAAFKRRGTQVVKGFAELAALRPQGADREALLSAAEQLMTAFSKVAGSLHRRA